MSAYYRGAAAVKSAAALRFKGGGATRPTDDCLAVTTAGSFFGAARRHTARSAGMFAEVTRVSQAPPTGFSESAFSSGRGAAFASWASRGSSELNVSLQLPNLEVPFQAVRQASSAANASQRSAETRRKAIAACLHQLDVVALEKSSGSLYSLGQAIESLASLEKSSDNSSRPLIESWNLENPELQKLVERSREIGRRRAELRSYRTMSQSAQNREIVALVICGFSGAFAAAIHPIFLLGTFGGAAAIATQRKAQALREEGVEELSRLNAEHRSIRLAIDERLRVLRSQLTCVDPSMELEAVELGTEVIREHHRK